MAWPHVHVPYRSCSMFLIAAEKGHLLVASAATAAPSSGANMIFSFVSVGRVSPSYISMHTEGNSASGAGLHDQPCPPWLVG